MPRSPCARFPVQPPVFSRRRLRLPSTRGALSRFLVLLAATLGLGLVPTPGAEPTKAELLAKIADLVRSVRTVTCQVEEQFIPAKGPPTSRAYRIWIRVPDHRRKIEPTRSGQESLHIEVGSVSWDIPHPKFIQKTVWPGTTHFIPTPVPDAGPMGELSPLLYLGLRDLDGETCVVFGNPTVQYWVSPADGLIRQRIQPRPAGDPTGTACILRFRSPRINQDLADDLFRPDLRPGATIQETVHGRDGKPQETTTVVPFPDLVAEPDGQAVLATTISRLREAWERTPNFSCLYQARSAPPGMRVGGRPYVAEATGTLRVARPDRLELRFSQRDTDRGEMPGLFFLTDGVTTWECLEPAPTVPPSPTDGTGREPTPATAAPPTRRVIAQNLARRRALLARVREATAAAASRALQLGMASPDRPGQPAPEAPPAEILPPTLRIPAFVLEPLAGLATASLRLDGEETVDGTATWRFVARETPTQRKSVHWIGQGDGLPRRIQEFDWIGSTVEREFRLTEVRAEPAPASGSFGYQPGPDEIVEDLTPALASMSHEMGTAFDWPASETFRRFFATPASAVRDLRGSGMAFLALDAYIAFRADEPVQIREGADFQPAPDPEPILAFFARAFPEEARRLRAPEATVLVRDRGPQDQRVWVKLPNGRHFFRVQQGGR